MKIKLLFPFFFIFNFQLFGQNKIKVQAELFNDVVTTQIMNNLEVNIPFFLFLQVNKNLYIGSSFVINHVYSDMYFRSQKENVNARNTFESELREILKGKFSGNIPGDSNIVIKCLLENKILFNLKYINDNGEKKEVFELEKSHFMREQVYNDFGIKSITTKKEENSDFLSYQYIGDTIKFETKYSTTDMKYALTEERYGNGVFLEKIKYKESAKRETGKIQDIEKYYYDQEGKLLIIRTFEGNKVIDSTNFYYEGENLSAIMKYEKNSLERLFLTYNKENQLVKKNIIKSDDKIEIQYGYNENGSINYIEFKSDTEVLHKKYFFEYNANSNLIKIEMCNVDNYSGDVILLSKYLFSYDENNFIKTLIAANSKGNFKKEVSYEIEYTKQK